MNMMSILILFVGLLLYAGYGVAGLVYLLSAAGLTYLLGRLIPKNRWLLWVGIIWNAAIVSLLKLQGILPLKLFAVMGISYFSLQSISYLADIYRGKFPPEKRFFRFALYFTYLPHLFIGPIERYDVFAPRLFEQRKMYWDSVLHGCARALWGGVKKLVIAARLGVVISQIAGAPDKYSGAYALAAMLLYSLQLYADFSGGMDMVIGISEMLGIRMSENFDRPYFSQSVKEFWNRWHMTLGTWLRDYVYIPLGGNRAGKARKLLNTLVTFFVSGFWHGANYLLWGLLNGVLVSLGNKLTTKNKTVNRIITFVLISLLWSFFIWPDAKTALQMTLSVVTVFNYGEVFSGIAAMGLTTGDWIVLAAALIALWQYDWHYKKIESWFCTRSAAVKTAVIGTLAMLVLVFGMYGLGFEADAFIYSRF